MNSAGGDWLCGACEHQNFKKRETCHKCGYPKIGGPDVSTYLYGNRTAATEVLAGDWYCGALNCGTHNYASRNSCFRCGNFKNSGSGFCYYGKTDDQMMMMAYGNDGGVYARPGWKTGDWICSRMGCAVHNYACRTECFKCKTPRNFSAV